jgi:ribosomal protein S18 acetylase RimI-like enzyme
MAAESGRMQQTRLPRDLSQIADLVEMCFGTRLDTSGRAAIREMKAVSRLGLLLWVLTPLEWVGMGLGRGYVWRVGNKVVGNVSLYRSGAHPGLGTGWLIANVAVHPNYRRRGIARHLMEAALRMVRRLGGDWVALQVESDNDAALALYDGMGFTRFETLDHWETSRNVAPYGESNAGVRRRDLRDGPAEADLIFNRARPGAMAWTRTLRNSDVPDVTRVSSLLGGTASERWVLPDPQLPSRLLGSLWVEAQSIGPARLTCFLDPAASSSALPVALLQRVLTRPSLHGKPLRLEMAAGNPALEALLSEAGFRRVRSLVQMRLSMAARA